jgi:hypothetical protein
MLKSTLVMALESRLTAVEGGSIYMRSENDANERSRKTNADTR